MARAIARAAASPGSLPGRRRSARSASCSRATEFDHLHDLAKDGEDLPAQMIALCPNCHAVKTRGSTRGELKQVLLAAARRRHDDLSQP